MTTIKTFIKVGIGLKLGFAIGKRILATIRVADDFIMSRIFIAIDDGSECLKDAKDAFRSTMPKNKWYRKWMFNEYE